MNTSSPPLRLQLRRNHLYLDALSYQTHLPNVASVALLRRNDDLVILPVAHAESGGFYIKQTNARGDRAIHAADFFRLNEIDETIDLDLEAIADAALAGFIVTALFKRAN